MKKIVAILLALMLVLAVSAMAEEVDMSVLAGKTVGFAQCDNRNSWRIAETDSMQAVADELGVTLIATDAGADLAKQASDIESLVAQNVDFLVVAPQEEDGLQSALQEAMDKGIPVILVDRNINGEAGVQYTAAIMSDFIWEAEQVANLFVEDSGNQGNIVILQGTQGATSTIDRQKGFMDVIEKSNMKVIADQVADYVMDKGQEVMENILQAQGDDVNYVFAHNDDMALGAIKAIEAAGKVPGVDIKVAGIDGPKAAMQAIIDGKELASCTCSPLFGPKTFETLAKIANGEEVPAFIQNTDTLYTAENVSLEAGY
ncbi:MAG: ABC transporter substrate-binding protein [Clostridia bacterium]|nr:ABC transporter substrate-binding protein [Clostridia bacterium]